MAELFWVAERASALGRTDCRFLVGVQTSEVLYLVVEGPLPHSDDGDHPGGWYLRVTGPEQRDVQMQGGSSSGSGDRMVIVAWYRPPPAGVDVLHVALELGGLAVMTVTARPLVQSG